MRSSTTTSASALAGVRGRERPEAGPTQVEREQLAHRVVVFDDQHRGAAGRPRLLVMHHRASP
jgi:hypothetical protein